MNNGIIKKISILAAVLAISGCSIVAPNNAAERPILSAAEAQAQIRVTVRPLAPIADPDTVVAAND